MVIDFDEIAEVHQMNFKGGNGPLDTRNYTDDKVKIMYSTLRPGASTGLHTHTSKTARSYMLSVAWPRSIMMVRWRHAARASAIIAPWAIAISWRTILTTTCFTLLSCPSITFDAC